MSAQVKIRIGDMFETATDLIILPCSTNGTVTPFVEKALSDHRLPRPNSSYKLGDADLRPFEDGRNVAQYLAFAVSVDNMSSNLEAIQRIATQIGEYTQQQHSIRSVAMPLLGAGSGGLLSTDVAKVISDGFKSTAHKDAVVTINVLHKNVFERVVEVLNAERSRPEPTSEKESGSPLRVFVSYTSTSLEHGKWVVELATYLRNNGVNARLDKWDLRAGENLNNWMIRELQQADRVLIISDAIYAEKANNISGGVGWETALIQNDVKNSPPDDTRHIVVVRDNDFDKGTPIYLKPRYCIHWAKNANDSELQEKLLREIYNRPLAPTIGEPPAWL